MREDDINTTEYGKLELGISFWGHIGDSGVVIGLLTMFYHS